MTQRPPIRHCPICRITMQGTKTRDDLKTFDRYDCLTCETTILAPPKDSEKR